MVPGSQQNTVAVSPNGQAGNGGISDGYRLAAVVLEKRYDIDRVGSSEREQYFVQLRPGCDDFIQVPLVQDPRVDHVPPGDEELASIALLGEECGSRS